MSALQAVEMGLNGYESHVYTGTDNKSISEQRSSHDFVLGAKLKEMGTQLMVIGQEIQAQVNNNAPESLHDSINKILGNLDNFIKENFGHKDSSETVHDLALAWGVNHNSPTLTRIRNDIDHNNKNLNNQSNKYTITYNLKESGRELMEIGKKLIEQNALYAPYVGNLISLHQKIVQNLEKIDPKLSEPILLSLTAIVQKGDVKALETILALTNKLDSSGTKNNGLTKENPITK